MADPANPEKYQYEILHLENDPQADCARLCAFLNYADANGFEPLWPIPLQIGQMQMVGGILKPGQRQSAFCVILKKKAEAPVNEQALLDSRQTA